MMTHAILDAGMATQAYDTVSILCGYTLGDLAIDEAKPCQGQQAGRGGARVSHPARLVDHGQAAAGRVPLRSGSRRTMRNQPNTGAGSMHAPDAGPLADPDSQERLHGYAHIGA